MGPPTRAANDRSKWENIRKCWGKAHPRLRRQSNSWYGGGTLSTRQQRVFPAKAPIAQSAGSLKSIPRAEELRQRWYRPCTLSAALALIFSVGAWAQTQSATISGTISDPSGAVVPGVSVTVVSQGTGLKRSVVTGTAGEYRFAGLPTGTYSLRLEKPGFQSQVREGVELNSAAEVMVNAQLAIGDLSQQANVSANVAAIDSTTSTSAGLLPEQSLAGPAPRQPRSFQCGCAGAWSRS